MQQHAINGNGVIICCADLLGNTTQLLAPHIFFANLFFLQNIYAPVFGTDGALWSLSFEFWYYILFPFLVLALYRGTPWKRRTFSIAAFLGLAWMLRGAVIPSFPIWLAGVGLYMLPPPRFHSAVASKVRVISTILYFAALILLAK